VQVTYVTIRKLPCKVVVSLVAKHALLYLTNIIMVLILHTVEID